MSPNKQDQVQSERRVFLIGKAQVRAFGMRPPKEGFDESFSIVRPLVQPGNEEGVGHVRKPLTSLMALEEGTHPAGCGARPAISSRKLSIKVRNCGFAAAHCPRTCDVMP
jgi:hypothetical protein